MMKEPFAGDREFNTPQEMLCRLAFLALLAAVVAGPVLLVAGAISGQARFAALGGLALAAAGALRIWLRRDGRLKRAEASLDALARPTPAVDASHVAELGRLLREWEELEGRRGTARFDPWALQAVRHEIRGLVETDPALEELFHEARLHRDAA